VSQDPIGFAAGDANLNRYIRNAPLGATDPLGLVEQLTADDLARALPYARLSQAAYTKAKVIEGTRVDDYAVKKVIVGYAGFRAVLFENV
jgi:hypothetical protein